MSFNPETDKGNELTENQLNENEPIKETDNSLLLLQVMGNVKHVMDCFPANMSLVQRRLPGKNQPCHNFKRFAMTLPSMIIFF